MASQFFPQDVLVDQITAEFTQFLNEYDPQMSNTILPPISKTKDISNGDFTVILKGACAKRKLDVEKYTTELAVALNEYLKENPKKLLIRAGALSGFINLTVNRSGIFQNTIKSVLDLGEKYGSSDKFAGKTVIIEHTSSNPNGPLHIGNLRNVMLGAHLSKLLSAVGYNVKQHFFVNDLGAQIGLTALGYYRIYPKVQPKLKIDQWIGMIYAVMNTLSELQIHGHSMEELLESYRGKKLLQNLPSIYNAKDGEEKNLTDKRQDGLRTLDSLYERQADLCVKLLQECSKIPSIKSAAAELNLQYERNEPGAVKIFREMVINCLSGVQQTLDTYNVHHDEFDFESELGWEGSNDRVMSRLKASPYFVPETQKNANGDPEGGHILCSDFIADAKLSGKKGYQKNFPNFYVLRPDGSTLYTFRDVVYSFKKCAQADLVFNIIASEQNLPQEKVSLTMSLLDPKAPRKLYHLSYELVKLERGGEIVKMSGRRGRYILADDLFEELKDAVIGFMEQKNEKFATFSKDELQQVGGEVATASMKYALLSTPCKHQINFDIAKAADPDEVSGPFLLYNAVRFKSLFRKFEEGVSKGEYPPLPSFEEIDFSLLTETAEWKLLLEFILPFPNLISQIASPNYQPAPSIPEFATNKLCDFCMILVNAFSSYFGNVRVLTTDPEKIPVMFARIYLYKALQTVLENALDILTMKPPERM